jgi:hypothetical protein
VTQEVPAGETGGDGVQMRVPVRDQVWRVQPRHVPEKLVENVPAHVSVPVKDPVSVYVSLHEPGNVHVTLKSPVPAAEGPCIWHG